MALVQGTDNSETIDQDWVPPPTDANDTIFARGGNDFAFGFGGADDIVGGPGLDDLFGGEGNDNIFGDEPNGTGTQDNDILRGEGGDDRLVGWGGADQYIGGSGIDIADYNFTAHTFVGITVNLPAGTAFGGLAEGDTFVGIENVLGTPFGDTIIGDAVPNVLAGASGADNLNGGLGDDRLYGTFESSGAGADTDVDVLDGGDNNDLLSGAGGGDGLGGGQGDDTLIGGNGGDLMFGEAGADIFQIAGSEGLGDSFFGGTETDTLLAAGPSAVTLSGFNALASSIERWIGNGLGIRGTSADNVFNFSYLTQKATMGVVAGQGGADKITGSKFKDSLHGGPGTDMLKGDGANDLLFGDTGADVLAGGDQNDRLTGGLGRDVMGGGTNKDVFDFNSINESPDGTTRDVIAHFQRGTDDIDLRTIDAKSGVPGNNAFKFIGTDTFNDVKGELRIKDLGAQVIVQGDVNGNGVADFEILVRVGALAKFDFLL
jgi:Ca2+-binding RTX toxin-like protein